MPFPPSKRHRRRTKRGLVENLNLTSMMDMFTIILLFLLMSYSAEGEILTVAENLQLPQSISTKEPAGKLTIQVTSDEIIVEGVKLITVKEAVEGKDMLIVPLVEALNKNTKKIAFIAQSNSSLKFSGEVLVQGDKSIPFLLLEKIMYSCGQAGYNNISLAVVAGG